MFAGAARRGRRDSLHGGAACVALAHADAVRVAAVAAAAGCAARAAPVAGGRHDAGATVLLRVLVLGAMIQLAAPAFFGNEEAYVRDALQHRQLSAGPYVARFETAFAALAGCEIGVATSSGTTALHLMLAALDIGPGDEVILPALTFVATANAVRYCGATPVLADVDPLTWCIDPDDVENRITSHTKAVLAVHLYGHPAPMTPLRAICDGWALRLLEDAAEAPGAYCDGQPVGRLGDMAAFSFYGNKIVTTGEGGMVTTNDAKLAERLRLLRGQGQDPERRHQKPRCHRLSC